MAEQPTIPCPSCGQPNPADQVFCRCCTAKLTERMPAWYLTVGALLLLLIGAIHFRAALTYRPAYLTFGELTPDKNFEKVRVLGRINRISVVREDYSNQTVKIELVPPNPRPRGAPADAITLKIEGEIARDFTALAAPPRVGDVVDVAATIYAGAGYRHLSLNGVQFIRVVESAPPPEPAAEAPGLTVAELLAHPEKHRDRPIHLPRAEVVYVSSDWPLVKVADPGSTNPVAVFGYEGRDLATGRLVAVQGTWEFYKKKGLWEIRVKAGDPAAVVPAAANAAGGK